MKRRAALLGLGAAAGLAAGGGTAIWRARHASEALLDTEPVPDLWTSQFASPAGAPVAMPAFAGKPLLLNFWATWCAPCVTEMPLLDAFAQANANAGWQVLALAIDQAEAVARFVAERSIRLRVALGGAAGLDLSRSLGNSAAALPFSVAFGSDGKVAGKKLGALDAGVLAGWAARIR